MASLTALCCSYVCLDMIHSLAPELVPCYGSSRFTRCIPQNGAGPTKSNSQEKKISPKFFGTRLYDSLSAIRMSEHSRIRTCTTHCPADMCKVLQPTGHRKELHLLTYQHSHPTAQLPTPLTALKTRTRIQY